MEHKFAIFKNKFCNLRQVHFAILNKYILPFWTNTLVNKRQIHFAILDKYILQFQTNTLHNWDKYISQFDTKTFLNFRKVHLSIVVGNFSLRLFFQIFEGPVETSQIIKLRQVDISSAKLVLGFQCLQKRNNLLPCKWESQNCHSFCS